MSSWIEKIEWDGGDVWVQGFGNVSLERAERIKRGELLIRAACELTPL